MDERSVVQAYSTRASGMFWASPGRLSICRANSNSDSDVSREAIKMHWRRCEPEHMLAFPVVIGWFDFDG